MAVRVNLRAEIWIVDCGPWRDGDSALSACFVCSARCDDGRRRAVIRVAATCSAQDLHPETKKEGQKRSKIDQDMEF